MMIASLIPKVLPAPSWQLALIYFIPSVIGLCAVIVRYRRYAHVPEAMQPKVKAGTLWMLAAILAMSSLIGSMIQW